MATLLCAPKQSQVQKMKMGQRQTCAILLALTMDWFLVCQRPVHPMFPRVLCPSRLDLLPGCNTGGGYTGTRLTSTVEVGLNLPFEGTGKEGDVLETGWCRYKRDIEATAKRGLRLEFGGNQVEAQTPSTHAHTHKHACPGNAEVWDPRCWWRSREYRAT